MRNGLLRSARPRPGSLKVLPCAALAAALGLGACSSSGSGSGTTTSTKAKTKAPPGAEATPADTVTSYLEALSRHNFSLAMTFIRAKEKDGIVAASGSGFQHLVSLDDIKVGPARTGKQYRPDANGDSFPKFSQFAQVTASYSATFSSGPGSGRQSRTVTLGENDHSKWLILTIQTS